MCVFLLEARFVFLYKKKKILYLVFTAKGFFSPSHSKTVAKPLCSFAPGALGCWWKADVARGWLHSLCVFLCVGWGVEWDWKSIIIEGTMPRHLEWKDLVWPESSSMEWRIRPWAFNRSEYFLLGDRPQDILLQRWQLLLNDRSCWISNAGKSFVSL